MTTRRKQASAASDAAKSAPQLSLGPIQAEPAYRLAARTLRDKIVAGELPIGAALPSEHAMADLLCVNRSTVREAIRLLEENGIIARKPGGKKLFVTAPAPEDLSTRMTTAMVLHGITVNELYGAMLALEPPTTATAARVATDEQIAALEANIEETRKHVGDREAVVELDVEFHDLVAEASGNRAILLSRRPLGALFYPAFDRALRPAPARERLIAAHTAIVAAIKARNIEDAENWMRKHIEDFRRAFDLLNLDINDPIAPFGSDPDKDEPTLSKARGDSKG